MVSEVNSRNENRSGVFFCVVSVSFELLSNDYGVLFSYGCGEGVTKYVLDLLILTFGSLFLLTIRTENGTNMLTDSPTCASPVYFFFKYKYLFNVYICTTNQLYRAV